MKKITLTLAGLFLLAIMAVSNADDKAADEKPWFDMKNCGFCKEITAQPGLMEHMKHHYYNLSNGIVGVLQVDPAYSDAFKKASEGMQAVSAGMSSGKIPAMCQHCEKMGGIMMDKNAKIDYVNTDFGNLTIYTSADATTLATMQAFAKRSNDEMAKMADMMKAEKK